MMRAGSLSAWIAALCWTVAHAPGAVGAQSAADAFPTRPVRVVVPFPPGGPNDTLARLLAAQLSVRWRQNVVVDNRGGAAAIIGTDMVAKSVPDGYTLLLVGSNIATNESMYKKLPYDAVRDFAPVTQLAATPYLLLVHPSVAATSVRQLIELARANPGKLNYASASTGAANHLAGELFKSMAGIDMTHIPYKGGGPALTDLLGGHVQLLFNNALTSMPHVRSGRVRLLAVSGAQRSQTLPEVPTVAESGLPGFDVSGWYGILAPAKTPVAILDRVHDDVVAVLRAPDTSEGLLSQGLEPVGNTRAQYAALIRSEIEKWRKVIQTAGIKPE